MTIWVIDIETKGLNAREFLCASLIKDSGKKKIFYDKDELWEYVLNGGRKEAKRNCVLNIYSHNAQYDFYGYANLNDNNIKFFSLNPLIASYRENGKDIIKFLDSYGIFKMSLKQLGNMIGLEKLELPEEFTDETKWNNITKERLKEIGPYVLRDSEIVMEALRMLKRRLKEEGITVRRIYTISQVAINYLMNKLRNEDKYKHLFEEHKLGKLYQTKYKTHIHSAYRGGRVECFKTGEIRNVNYIDRNNLYGYSSTLINFPDLKTEKFVYSPLKYFELKTLLRTIGISRALIYNKNNEIGLIPVRTNTGSYYPKKESYILGTYTNMELEEAIKEGYEIVDIEWSIIWEETINVFQDYIPKLYELRMKENNPFNKWFYKEMQNRSFGKLAQTKAGYEIVIDNVEEAQKYLEESWKIIGGQSYNYIYEKEKDYDRKNYYAPIIPTLINAYARILMYREFKKIPINDLIYHDTDSILFTGNHLDKFNIGEKLGQFKIEHKNERTIIYGRKTYAIGEEMKISGFRKKDMKIEEFEKGYIKNKKMISLISGRNTEKAGTFIEEERNLKEQLLNFTETEKIMLKEKIFKDINLTNINYFTDKLSKIVDRYT